MDNEYSGSQFTNPVPGVVVGCTSPEARELIDSIMSAYRDHYDPEMHVSTPEDVYQFTYWLCRWSGLVFPVSALTDWRYGHGEIEAACGGEMAQEVRKAVMARRERICGEMPGGSD